MRIARIDSGGTSSYAVLHDEHVEILDREPWAGGTLTGERLALESVRLLAPVSPSTIFCVGRNYADHIREMGYEAPTRPSLFIKPLGALLDPYQDVVLPPVSLSDDVEHEAELVVVMGRSVRNVEPSEALDAVFGYTVANDVSARDLQRVDTDVVRAKGFDTFCPVAPWIQTEVDISAGLTVVCRVNAEVRQDGNTSDLIFDVPYLVSYLSRFTTLRAGDIILTGSPGGSGPLRPGDDVEIEIGGVGTLRHGVTRQ
jgi:2-keto-4-pentenoate hydratase/2-oxohepta-3-ene-1,7-dioic acid hydratase in catechol pathway|tara:strand:- start:8035 stop:8802 length:768 start_codon:yes stop_codon:yes gene_type:complete